MVKLNPQSLHLERRKVPDLIGNGFHLLEELLWISVFYILPARINDILRREVRVSSASA